MRTRVCLLCWRPRVDWSQYFCRVKEATWRTKIGQMTKAAHAVTGGTTTLAAADKVEAGRRVPMIGIGISVMIVGTAVGSGMIVGIIVPMVIGIGTSAMIVGITAVVVMIAVMIGAITEGAIVGIGATNSHGLPGSAQTGVAKIAAMTDLAARSRSHTRLNTVQQTLTSP